MQFLLGFVDKCWWTNSTTSDNTYPKKVAQALGSSLIKDKTTHIAEECPICLDTPLIEKASIANCGHFFCKDSVLNVLKKTPDCSMLYTRSKAQRSFSSTKQRMAVILPCFNMKSTILHCPSRCAH